MDGLFYVSDPTNGKELDKGPDDSDKIWGYNDLMMRSKSLCNLLNRSCNDNFSVIDAVSQLRFSPFPLGAH